MTRRIVQLGRSGWREVAADDSGVLIDAADYDRAFHESGEQASRYNLVSGWQFDGGVPLLRGDDAPPGAEVRFLSFLNGRCAVEPELHVFILAWDSHMVLAAEREWMQRIYFHWMTSPRFRFLFDDCPVAGGSHHQKFAVFDGTHGFLGGMDVCEARWDDRYLETQYFGSRRICEALAARMRATTRSRLEIVVLVNERAEASKEELAVGLRQA